jgi:hypothetical protein
MADYASVVSPLSAALGLSLAVERTLELAQNVFERALLGPGDRAIPDPSEGARRVQALATAATVEKQRAEEAWQERVPPQPILVEPATDANAPGTARVLMLQLLGFAAGIVVTRISGLQLFHALLGFAGGTVAFPPWVDYLMTGLLIGAGSGPIHVLLRFVTARKVEADAEPVPAEEDAEAKAHVMSRPLALVAAVPAVIESPTAWVDIPYDGGVDREPLEGVHRRPGAPNLIVFHHTAMAASSSFEDVVRVIKSRTDSKGNRWLTGYHCVITADGQIHPFCRWDRTGNHVAGFNARSLGLAFNGNFETDPKVPCSNPDGRYGPARPTEAQVRSGARVIALWALVYGIGLDLNFGDTGTRVKPAGGTVLPHAALADKACPGSSFPYAELANWVKAYHDHWASSAQAQAALAAFRLKPYVFA